MLLSLFWVKSSGIVVVELEVIVRHGSLSIHIVVTHFPLMHDVDVELVMPLACCSSC